MKYLKTFLTRAALVLACIGVLSSSYTPVAFAASTPGGGGGGSCNTSFLTFPTWYNGLAMDSNCRIKLSKLNDVWVIAFNLLNIAIQVAAYVAVAIIFAMIFQMLTARGDPGKIASAGLGIRNAIIGLVIALISVAIVNFVTTSIAGAS